MDQKNLIVAIVMSVLIIIGWQALFPPAKPPVNNTAQQQQQTTTPSSAPGTPQAPPGQPTAPGVQPATAANQVVSREEALQRSPRVTFDTPELVGSIALSMVGNLMRLERLIIVSTLVWYALLLAFAQMNQFTG